MEACNTRTLPGGQRGVSGNWKSEHGFSAAALLSLGPDPSLWWGRSVHRRMLGGISDCHPPDASGASGIGPPGPP